MQTQNRLDGLVETKQNQNERGGRGGGKKKQIFWMLKKFKFYLSQFCKKKIFFYFNLIVEN